MSKARTQLEQEAIERVIYFLYANDLVLIKRRRNKYGGVVLDEMEREELEDAVWDIYEMCKKDG